MRIVVFGDMHGMSLGPMEAFLDDNTPDVVVCLGDFDRPLLVRQWIEISGRLDGRGVRVITVPGNHDQALAEGLEISSPLFEKHDTSYKQLREEFMQDAPARQYLCDLLSRETPGLPSHAESFDLDPRAHPARFHTIAVHGALAGNLFSAGGLGAKLDNLWFRLQSDADHVDNFRAMKKSGFQLMLRAHDHAPMLASMGEDGRPLIVENDALAGRHHLAGDRLHVINAGAYHDGHAAVIHTKPRDRPGPVVEFIRLF